MNANTLNTLSDVAGADIAREKAEAAATVASTAKDAAELAANSSEESKDAAAKSEAAAKQYADNAAAIVTTDPTLTVKGAPADAKATGDRINAIKIETDKTGPLAEQAAKTAAELQDALCEQDAATDERVSTLEDAVCELDAAVNK